MEPFNSMIAISAPLNGEEHWSVFLLARLFSSFECTTLSWSCNKLLEFLWMVHLLPLTTLYLPAMCAFICFGCSRQNKNLFLIPISFFRFPIILHLLKYRLAFHLPPGVFGGLWASAETSLHPRLHKHALRWENKGTRENAFLIAQAVSYSADCASFLTPQSTMTLSECLQFVL